MLSVLPHRPSAAGEGWNCSRGRPRPPGGALAWLDGGDGRGWFGLEPDLSVEEFHQYWREVHAPDCREPMMEHWRASIASGQSFEMEFPIRGADGQYRWFLTRANPVRDSAGQMLRWFGTSTDVDQVKRAQEALRDETNILEMLNSTGNALARAAARTSAFAHAGAETSIGSEKMNSTGSSTAGKAVRGRLSLR